MTLLNEDERKTKQMLLNLLSNAIKFTPKGGTVTVSAAVDSRGGLTLAVTDNGIGMSEEEARGELAKKSPQNRIIMPSEVGATVAWLCLPGSESITGQSIAMAGGAWM